LAAQQQSNVEMRTDDCYLYILDVLLLTIFRMRDAPYSANHYTHFLWEITSDVARLVQQLRNWEKHVFEMRNVSKEVKFLQEFQPMRSKLKFIKQLL